MIESISKQIIDVCQRLHHKNMLASADGNVSVRLSNNEILITPKGKTKARLNPNDFAILNLEGKVLKGEPSSESLMHLTVYQNVPFAKAVVHAHPPHAIAWSIACPDFKFLPDTAMSELHLATGGIPFVPYACPSTAQMGENLLPFLSDYRALILSRHGALTYGESLEEAYGGMERLEHAAYILYLAQNLGGLTHLTPEEMDALRVLRKKIGPKLY